MPATANANDLTLVHAGSSGVAMCFPDVCKTPTPGGPVPIPYPNVAQSSDTADGSTTVKVDGNPIMLKSSSYGMSSGDEAGSAQGVVSNKIKGKATPVNVSFDVKVDGKGVFRLTDPMQSNCGNPGNGQNPANVQPPNPVVPFKSPECEKTKEKKDDQEKQNTSWGDCGIVEKHQPIIQAVTDELRMVVYFRKTKHECAKWIVLKHQPKPHSCIKGTTITADHLPKVQRWLDAHSELQAKVPPEATNRTYAPVAEVFIGIIGNPLGEDPATGDTTMIQPLRGYGTQVGCSYNGKWMTGDYDLFQVLWASGKCTKVTGGSFRKLRRTLNKRLEWDAIQHGPQAQWNATKRDLEKGVKPFDMNKKVHNVLRGHDDAGKPVPVTDAVEFSKKRKPMKVIDTPLTVVCGKTVVTLKDEQAVVDALKCKKCGE
jgi:hypothetical protein